MPSSRDFKHLVAPVLDMARRHLSMLSTQGYDAIITCTYRDGEDHKRVFDSGRFGNGGRLLTNDKPGESLLHFGCAYTLVPLVLGQPLCTSLGNDKDVWMLSGRIGESVGMTWGARQKGGFAKYQLFTYSGGLTLDELKAGRIPRLREKDS